MSSLYLDDGDFRLYVGDVREVLGELDAESVDCVVTSPPYFGLRDYGTGTWEGGDPDCDHSRRSSEKDDAITSESRPSNVNHEREGWKGGVCGRCGATKIDRQIGLEGTVEEYVAELVAVFREVDRVLAPHGTVWLNLGDSYVSDSTYSTSQTLHTEAGWKQDGDRRPNVRRTPQVRDSKAVHGQVMRPPASTLPAKSLLGVPWRVALALQDDGWILRSDVIWAKPNTMPESVNDRPTKAHEYVFLLVKRGRYYFDADAVREPSPNAGRRIVLGEQSFSKRQADGMGVPRVGNANADEYVVPPYRNVRSVWEITTHPYKGAHFATFPPKLVERCILAGCPEQVCTVCGKPRERIVERGEPVLQEDTWSATGAAHYDDEAGGYIEAEDTSTLKHIVPRETIGWTECGCAYGLKPDDLELIASPLAPDGREPDPTMQTGRKGLGRPRVDGEGRRYMTRYEQRAYARQLREIGDPRRETVICDMGVSRAAWDHYVREDRAGARPMPPDLLERLIELGWIERVELPEPTPGTYRPGIVLDPFMGSGTTALVARSLARHAIGVELNPEYAELCARRCQQLSLFT